MMALENILSQEIIQKLGWTLLHFVWQAAAVAVLLAILLAVLRKSSANLRYIITSLALGLIVLLPIVTMQLVPVSIPQPAANVKPPSPVSVVLPAEQIREMPSVEMAVVEEPLEPQSAGTASIVLWKQRVIELLEPALPYIVLGWLIGVFGLSVWHLGGWAQLQRLRKKMVKQVDASLHRKLSQLSERLGVKRAVQLVESALVQIPTVVGWLRPVILLPASALTGLNTEQLEALLAHELAHIRRYDYLVNMLQTVVEILGFYHPAVWWVSHKMRVERENCCDDLAVSISADRVRYARALTSMEEIRAKSGELAVAASGGSLLGRISRLVGKDSADSSRAGWLPSVITILLIAIIALPTTFALTNKPLPQQAELKTDVPVEGKFPSDGILMHEGFYSFGEGETYSKRLSQIFRKVQTYIEQMSAGYGNKSWDDVSEGVIQVRNIFLGLKESVEVNEVRAWEAFTKMWKGEKIDANEAKLVDLARTKRTLKILASIGGDYDEEETYKNLCNSIVSIADVTNEIQKTLRTKRPTMASPYIEKLQADWSTLIEIDGIKELLRSGFPAKEKSDVTVDVGTLAEGQRKGQSLAGSVPSVPMLEKSPAPSAEGKTCVLIDCLIIEVFSDLKIDRGTIIEAEKLMGLTFDSSIAGANLLRKAAAATAATEDAAVKDKRVTKDQFNALIEMLASHGYMKILMNPTPQVLEGQTAKIHSTQGSLEDLIQITPNVLEDGKIILQVEATLSSLSIRQGNEQTPVIDKQEISARTRVRSGECRIVGGIKKTRKTTDADSNVKGAEERTSEVLLILTPTIVAIGIDPQKKVESAQKLKQLGAAVVTYAEEHDDNLPDTLGELRPYIASVEDFRRIVENVEYLGKGKNIFWHEPWNTPVAYDKTLLEEFSGTNVAFLDGHVEFFTPERLKELGISKAAITVIKPGEFVELYEPMETMNLKNVDMRTIIEKLAKWTGKAVIPTDELTKQKITIYTPEKMPRNNAIAVIYSALRLKGYIAEQTDEAILLKPVKEATPGETPTILDDEPLTMVENKAQVVQKLFKLKNCSPSQMGQIVAPLLNDAGSVIADEKTGSLLAIDTVQNLMRIEKVIAEFDVLQAGQTVTEIFEIRYGDPLEIVRSLRMLITNNTDAVSSTSVVIGPSQKPVLLIPEPRRNRIIAKASAEDMKLIGGWIDKLDQPDTAIKEYEVAQIEYADASEVADRINEALQQMPGKELKTSVLIQPLENTNQIIIFGRADLRDMVKKLIAEIDKRVEDSAEKLKRCGRALLMYAKDHDDKYPDSLHQLRGFLKTEDFVWTRQNVRYLGKGKTVIDPPDIPIACDNTLLEEGNGTNVLFNDSHVEFVSSERLGIGKEIIQIEAQILMVSDDFLKDIGLDANSVYESEAWSEHLIAEPAAEPNSQTYALILDELNVSFFLKAAQAHKSAKMLVAPRVNVWDGSKATVFTVSDIPYVSGYSEPNRPGEKPVPKRDSATEGIKLHLMPELSQDKKYVDLNLEGEFSQFRGFEEHKYKGKYPYQKLLMDVVSTKKRHFVPDGGTLLIVGQKTAMEITSQSSVPVLGELPVVGGLFRSYTKTTEPRRLLILAKPTILSPEQAVKVGIGTPPPEKIDYKNLGNPLGRQLEYMNMLPFGGVKAVEQ